MAKGDKKQCPLMYNQQSGTQNCIEERCAWWHTHAAHGQCSIKRIAEYIKKIEISSRVQ
jgi:hypothetical protein